jgi:hypothetical protein
VFFDLVAPDTRLKSYIDHLAVSVTKAEHASRFEMLQEGTIDLIGVLRIFMGKGRFRVEKVIIFHVGLFHEVKETVVGSQRTKLFDIRRQLLEFLLISQTIPIT